MHSSSLNGSLESHSDVQAQVHSCSSSSDYSEEYPSATLVRSKNQNEPDVLDDILEMRTQKQNTVESNNTQWRRSGWRRVSPQQIYVSLLSVFSCLCYVYTEQF